MARSWNAQHSSHVWDLFKHCVLVPQFQGPSLALVQALCNCTPLVKCAPLVNHNVITMSCGRSATNHRPRSLLVDVMQCSCLVCTAHALKSTQHFTPPPQDCTHARLHTRKIAHTQELHRNQLHRNHATGGHCFTFSNWLFRRRATLRARASMNLLNILRVRAH